MDRKRKSGADELERRKRHQFHHFPKLRKVERRFLHFLQTVSDRVGLVDDLVEAVAHGGLLQEIVDGRHFGAMRVDELVVWGGGGGVVVIEVAFWRLCCAGIEDGKNWAL